MIVHGRMAAVMDELVSGAHSTRDGVINSLDAVGRRTRAANAALVAHVRGLTLDREPGRPGPVEGSDGARERDTRFDPEDEWELPGRGAQPAAAAPGASPRQSSDDDDEDYPQTWLR